MSVDCDCAGTYAAEPVIPDLGMMASTDILAIDQASVDMVYNLEDSRKNDLIERNTPYNPYIYSMRKNCSTFPRKVLCKNNRYRMRRVNLS